MDYHPVFVILTLVSCASIASAQTCDFPSQWYNATTSYGGNYYRDYTGTAGSATPEFIKVTSNTFVGLSTSTTSTCIDQDTTGQTVTISFQLDNGEYYCFEGIHGGGPAIFLRSSPNVVRTSSYTAAECLTELGDRVQFHMMANFPFDETDWEAAAPASPGDGTFKFTYRPYSVISGTETCVDEAATLTIAGNKWTATSNCVTGDQQYTNPMAGQLKLVASLSDSALSIATGDSSSGMIIVAIDTPGLIPSVLDYSFLIMRYHIIDNPDMSKSMEFFFTTGSPKDPPGYLSMDLIPTSEQMSIISFQLQSDECKTTALNNCTNNGTCIQLWQDFSCDCIPGFDGTLCENNINECSPNPCENGGACTDGINSYTCECTAGWAGSKCQYVDRCSPDPCENGATCYTVDTEYLCVCTEGWIGRNCDRQDLCELDDPCENGGSCSFNDRGLFCHCVDGYVGQFCEIFNATGGCIDVECENGGVCMDIEGGSYYCECTIYYEGEYCEDLSDWFVVTLVLAALLGIILIILFIVCCCYCCCGWRPNNTNYATMDNSESSSFKMDTLPPSTVEFNFSPATPSYGIQMIRSS